MITVLVVDDQPMIRVGVRAILEAQEDITVVGEAEDGRVAVREAHRLRPDVVLMDVRMPELDGLAAARAILGEVPELAARPRVLMLTTFDADRYVYEALRAGAGGFLLKDSRAEKIVDAVRGIASGEALLSPGITRRLIERFVEHAPSEATTTHPLLRALTARELEVLELIAHGLSNTEIAGSLVIAEQTVKTHVTRILQKLGLRDRVQAVVFGYENRLVVPGS